jgi:C1A family cysteine protease
MFINPAIVAAVGTILTGAPLQKCEFLFNSHVAQYNLDIPVEDFHFRTQVFCDNVDFIDAHNAKNLTYTLGLNAFAHLTHEEFLNAYTTSAFARPRMGGMFRAAPRAGLRAGTNAPASIDWVSKGGVTPVKDQGQCGSCWSFSTTGSMEGAYFVKYRNLVSFSEQELVDCSSPLNHGCNGGLPDRAFRWIENNGGLCTEGDYPYVSGTTLTAGTCKTCTPVKGSQVSGWTDLDATNQAMVNALAVQPVSIAIEADQRAFQFYSGGVFPASECGNNLDHAVLAVGYDANSYRVKNSWGTSWGDAGYIYFEKSDAAEKVGGTCGMLMEASTVQLA